MTAVIEANGLGKRYGRQVGALGVHARDPGRQGRRARRPERRRQDDAAPPLRRPPATERRVDLGARRATRHDARPSSPASVSWPRTPRPTRGFSIADHLRFGRWMNPSWDAKLAKGADRAPRTRSPPEGRQALGWPARQLALTLAVAKRPGAVGARRAGRQPRSPRAARVPAESDRGRCRLTARASSSPRTSWPISSGSATTSSSSSTRGSRSLATSTSCSRPTTD